MSAMRSDIDDRLRVIAAGITTLVSRLRSRGFLFDSDAQVFPGVDPNVERHIHRIEQEIGTVPYAVAQFWRTIGSVDLCGSHPNWTGCDLPDPLVVFPASVAAKELQEFLDDREERMKYNFPYLIPISPDEYHKENVSGGMWYNVNCPAIADDPSLNDERHRTTFLGYLEIALRWGGFPGLERCHGNTWPIERLIASFDTSG